MASSIISSWLLDLFPLLPASAGGGEDGKDDDSGSVDDALVEACMMLPLLHAGLGAATGACSCSSPEACARRAEHSAGTELAFMRLRARAWALGSRAHLPAPKAAREQ